MKIILFVSLALASALSLATAAEEKTFGQKAGEALDKAAQKTKKTAEAIAEKVTPDADARKVEVTLSEKNISMPKSLSSGKTAFVVTNNGKGKHNFEIEGQGIDKKFMLSLDPKDTKTLHVELKPGTYKVSCPVGDHAEEGMKLDLTVK